MRRSYFKINIFLYYLKTKVSDFNRSTDERFEKRKSLKTLRYLYGIRSHLFPSTCPTRVTGSEES